MLVREVNVQTGEKTSRPYTQKELDDIEAAKPTQKEVDDRELARLRLEALKAEEEKLLLSGTSSEAVAYQTAKTQ